MAEDKGSDLDVFEGLSKKKRSSSVVPPAPGTMRGGLAPPSSKPLPPPKKSGALPTPGGRVSGPPSGLPAPRPPSSRGDSDAPVVSVKTAPAGPSSAAPMSGPVSAAPGVASADLDWDDEEEATSVFDKSSSDLFHDLGAARRGPEESGRRNVSKAAALLASSGRSAQPVARARIPSEPMPRIPAPAPVPRDISEGARDSMPMSREAGPSWQPSQAPPPQPQPSGGGGKTTLVLALVAVVVLAAASFFYLQRSSDASVTIAVTHNGKDVEAAEIFVDGQRKCEFAPCKLELSPGSKNVRVKSGNLAGEKTIAVEGGKEFSFEIVLGVASDVAPPDKSAEPATDEPAKLELASAMKDVEITVTVDGKSKGKLPVTLDDLEPGKHELVFEGSDKFGKVTKTVDLKAGESLKIDDIKLPLQKVKAVFVLETRGADVKLLKLEGDDQKGEQRLTFRGNEATETLDTSFTWKLVATHKGHEDFEKVLDFSGVEDELKVSIELDEAKEPEKPAPVASTPGPAPVSKTPDPQPQPQPPDTAKAEFGTINANSIPPSKVVIDGRPRGGTPVAGVKVSAGVHTVVFIHSEYGTMSRTVTVKPGQTATAVVRFKKPGE